MQAFSGVACQWIPELDLYITRLTEGNERVIPILLKLSSLSLCIMNCYPPVGSDRTAQEIYASDVALASELGMKYQNKGYSLLIGGDLNADLFNRHGRKEKQMKSMVKILKLENLNTELSDQVTYKNKSKPDKSHIDYFLVSHTQLWERTSLTGKHYEGSSNTSTHCAITNRLCLLPGCHTPRCRKPKAVSITPRPLWHKADPTEYCDMLDEISREIQQEHMEVAMAVDVLTKAPTAATKVAVPQKKRCCGPRKPWTPELAEASSHEKWAFHCWNEAGDWAKTTGSLSL